MIDPRNIRDVYRKSPGNRDAGFNALDEDELNRGLQQKLNRQFTYQNDVSPGLKRFNTKTVISRISEENESATTLLCQKLYGRAQMPNEAKFSLGTVDQNKVEQKVPFKPNGEFQGSDDNLSMSFEDQDNAGESESVSFGSSEHKFQEVQEDLKTE